MSDAFWVGEGREVSRCGDMVASTFLGDAQWLSLILRIASGELSAYTTRDKLPFEWWCASSCQVILVELVNSIPDHEITGIRHEWH